MPVLETSELEEASEVAIDTGRVGAADPVKYGNLWRIAFGTEGAGLYLFIISLPNTVLSYPPT